MITVEKLKDKLQKEFGWENLDSNEYKWFIDNLLRDSIKAINFTGSSLELRKDCFWCNNGKGNNKKERTSSDSDL